MFGTALPIRFRKRDTRQAGGPAAGQRGSGGRLPAFTLAELLITIAIIGTLAALMLPAVFGAQLTARVTQVRSDLRQIDLALHNYWLHFEAYPPTRLYCNTDTRDRHRCLPEELWEFGFLDTPLYDPFSRGQTYRYTAIGPGYVNGNPTPISMQVPDTFPQPGGTMVREGEAHNAPVKWIGWSVGPNGTPHDFAELLQLHPADPAGWYPHDPRGIIVRYHDGNCGISPE